MLPWTPTRGFACAITSPPPPLPPLPLPPRIYSLRHHVHRSSRRRCRPRLPPRIRLRHALAGNRWRRGGRCTLVNAVPAALAAAEPHAVLLRAGPSAQERRRRWWWRRCRMAAPRFMISPADARPRPTRPQLRGADPVLPQPGRALHRVLQRGLQPAAA